MRLTHEAHMVSLSDSATRFLLVFHSATNPCLVKFAQKAIPVGMPVYQVLLLGLIHRQTEVLK